MCKNRKKLKYNYIFVINYFLLTKTNYYRIPLNQWQWKKKYKKYMQLSKFSLQTHEVIKEYDLILGILKFL